MPTMVQVADMGAREVLLGVGLVFVGAPLAVLSDVPSPWNFVLAGVVALAGVVLIVSYLRSSSLMHSTNALDSGVSVLDARAAADHQLEQFRRQRSALELAAQGADGSIEIIDLSGNPPSKPLDVVDGGETYRLKFSSSGGEDVWVYGDDPSIRSLAIERFAQRGDVVDAPNLRQERGANSVRINQRVFAITRDNKVIQVLILSVRYYNSGDNSDELRVSYRVYPPGEFLIPAL